MATIPERAETLNSVIDSIIPQVDKLFIYFNNCHSLKTLHKLSREKLTFKFGDNLGANGKFKFLDKPYDYYFSIDDDFIYPKDYVKVMIAKIEKYKRKAVMCVHGSTFPPHPDWYYERINSYSSREGTEKDHLVNLPGTGTVAFHKDTFRNMTYDRFNGSVKCDLKLAIACHDQGIPIISVMRKKNWLRPITTDGPDYWSRCLSDDEGRTELAQTKDWSFWPSRFFPEKPDYWAEVSQLHLITRFRYLSKFFHGGIHDMKYFMKYPLSGLKEIVESLEEKKRQLENK